MKSPINTILNPNWVTGFSDRESSFMIIVSKSNTHKIGYKIKAVLGITLHSNDVGILKDIGILFRLLFIITIFNFLFYYISVELYNIIDTEILYTVFVPVMIYNNAETLR